MQGCIFPWDPVIQPRLPVSGTRYIISEDIIYMQLFEATGIIRGKILLESPSHHLEKSHRESNSSCSAFCDLSEK